MKTITLQNNTIDDVYKNVIDVLKAGGLVVVPSDTVYGLSVDAMNTAAVEKLIAFKARPAGKPISVFTGSISEAEKYVEIVPESRSFIDMSIPGPYTLVLPSKHVLSGLLESEYGTLGIRVPDFEFINNLVLQFGSPVTATSANIAGESPHYSVESLLNSLSEKKKAMIDLIIDGGKLPRKQPSTVVDLTADTIKILRQGDAGATSIGMQKYISSSEEETKRFAQELLNKNYDSRRPVVFLLYGEMGAGKTIFVKGMGESLGIADITSPTFVIYYEYPISTSVDSQLKDHGMFYHFDLYRVGEESEFDNLGIEGMLKNNSILAIEWSEKSEYLMKLFEQYHAQIVSVSIEHVGNDENDQKRSIKTWSF